jgi:hypothetical protein
MSALAITTTGLLCGLLQPSGGRAGTAGLGVARELAQIINSVISYVSQEFSPDDELTTHENLSFYGRLYGLRGTARAWGISGSTSSSLPGGGLQCSACARCDSNGRLPEPGHES